MSSDEEDIDSIEEEEEEVIQKPKRKRKKKKKDPNRPKRNMSAFFLYSNANRQRVKEENPEAKFGDIAKLLSVEFKAISASERAKWDELAVEDKERYQREMEDYEPPSESDSDSDSDAPKKSKKKKKKKKDPNAPKRNQSSFFLYSNATRNDVKTANPEAKFGEIAQIISRHFKALRSRSGSIGMRRRRRIRSVIRGRWRFTRERSER
ncbi:hypothetical protein ACHAXR_009214 [Thalassiosira sp. AJA248-18]